MADVHLLALGNFRGVAIGTNVEADDDGVRRRGQQHVRLVDRADAGVNDLDAHALVGQLRQRIGQHRGGSLAVQGLWRLNGRCDGGDDRLAWTPAARRRFRGPLSGQKTADCRNSEPARQDQNDQPGPRVMDGVTQHLRESGDKASTQSRAGFAVLEIFKRKLGGARWYRALGWGAIHSLLGLVEPSLRHPGIVQLC